MTGRRILAVLPDHPWPTDMGSRVRNLRILEALAGRFELTIVSLLHDRAALDDPGPAARLGRFHPVLASHRRGAVRWAGWHLRARAAGLVRGLHPETYFQSLPVLAATVRRVLESERPDLVHAAYWYGLRRLRRFPRPPLWVVDTHDVQFERHERLLGRVSAGEKRQELAELGRYDRIVAITGRDARTLEASLPAPAPPIDVIGMGLDLQRWRPEAVERARPAGERIAFYGNLATEANQEGARHLLEAILPAVRRAIPGAEGLLIGAGLTEPLRALAGRAGAEATGFVPDPRPWLRSAAVLALTLRTGSGQRGRVVEAVSLGVPVVGYPEALEGLDLREGEGVMAARSAEEMAATIIRLLRDEAFAARVAADGRRRVEACYGWDATYGRFPDLYERLLAAR